MKLGIECSEEEVWWAFRRRRRAKENAKALLPAERSLWVFTDDKGTPTRRPARLQQLDRARIHYTLASYREGAIMVCTTVPGRRYEREVFEDETVQVEVFGSTGDILGEDSIDDLLANDSDNSPSS